MRQPKAGASTARVGVEALYLSLSPQTALEEYRQGSSLVQPATLVSYLVTLDAVADLSGGFDPDHWDAQWADWNCPWRRIARIDKATPPSWLLADLAISVGYKGFLFPSTRHPGGTNLVAFAANFGASDRLMVHDPENRLPKDQSCWPA